MVLRTVIATLHMVATLTTRITRNVVMLMVMIVFSGLDTVWGLGWGGL